MKMDCMKWKQYGRELDWKEEIRNHLKNEINCESTRRRQREWPKKRKDSRNGQRKWPRERERTTAETKDTEKLQNKERENSEF